MKKVRIQSSPGAMRLVLIPFFLVGAAAISLGGYQAYTTHRFLQQAVKVPGEVVRLVGRKGTVAGVVQYTDRSGERRTVASKISSNPPAFHVGEAVEVLYDPEDPDFPSNARVDTAMELWGLAGFAFLFGGVFSGISALIWGAMAGPSQRRR